MKRILFLFTIATAILISPAFVLSKGKDKQKPADGVQRKYKSKPIKKPQTVKLPCGIEFTITAKGNGPVLKTNDKVTVLYVGKLENDTVFDASYKHGNDPLPFVLGAHQVIPGWDTVFLHLRAGDKATMKIPPQYGYGARPRGRIPANSTLIFNVEVIDVTPTPPPPTPWDAKGKDTITTPSGLKVVMFESHPEAVQAKAGNTVSVAYSGFFLDGKMFDSSIPRNEPYTFVLGQGRVIKGWDEGIALLHKGEKAKLIVPYTLAYGEAGYPGAIPPKATLVFDVQLVDVK